MASSIPSASICDIEFCSNNCCEYTLTNESGSQQNFTYTACTNSDVIISAITDGLTIIFCASGSPEYNQTFLTLDLNGCCSSYVSFQECYDNNITLRFSGLTESLNQGETYYIDSIDYSGYATVIPYEATGTIYSSEQTSFTLLNRCPYYSGVTTGQTWSYYDSCGDLLMGSEIGLNICVDTYKDYFGVQITDSTCTKSCMKAALLYKCSDSTVFYGLVDEDTAFVGGVYVYEGECYSFVEFSGPGGPDLGTPDFADCQKCIAPTPTPTINLTPSVTPSITPSPATCNIDSYCFRTYYSDLFEYSGNYYSAGTYNNKIYYSGDGSTVGYVYYNFSEWCLSVELGGDCLLKGASPCYSVCPDLFAGVFNIGECVTPTPTPSVCEQMNFDAYFDCAPKMSPSQTASPTPSITPSVTITNTPSSSLSDFEASLIGFRVYPQDVVDETTETSSERNVEVAGSVKFNLINESFNSVSVKVLVECGTNVEYYTNQNLIYDNNVVGYGTIIKVLIDNEIYCLQYIRDDVNLSSNIYITDILSVTYSCEYCYNMLTPTPTTTNSPTPSVTPTNTQTPSSSPPPKISATGGTSKTITTVNGIEYYVHTFNATNPMYRTFEINSGYGDIDYILIGGGGGSGISGGETWMNAGGGGGGQIKTGTISVSSGEIYQLTIGSGGTINNFGGETNIKLNGDIIDFAVGGANGGSYYEINGVDGADGGNAGGGGGGIGESTNGLGGSGTYGGADATNEYAGGGGSNYEAANGINGGSATDLSSFLGFSMLVAAGGDGEYVYKPYYGSGGSNSGGLIGLVIIRYLK